MTSSSSCATVFVSSQAVDRWPAQALIRALRNAGCDVEHSPSNPADGNDARWATWYASGLAATLERCRIFVVIVDRGWDSSTWMGEESEKAIARGVPLRRFFWNPDRVHVVAQAMTRYLAEELPAGIDDAVQVIQHEASV
jgi:hypothetical protein